MRLGKWVHELTERLLNRKQDVKECGGGLRTIHRTHKPKKKMKRKKRKMNATYAPISMLPDYSTQRHPNLLSYTGDQSV
jgi:hypothetical protein